MAFASQSSIDSGGVGVDSVVVVAVVSESFVLVDDVVLVLAAFDSRFVVLQPAIATMPARAVLRRSCLRVGDRFIAV
ncbi:hypothetical protein C452_00105 [Haloferax volcanii JCM 10717]|uniref:Uncharacterized protein n=2 Tax=Haloferax volcanii TaxID=2246 RepID=M0II51_HALVO|nr:hypothetical protein C456_01427 [Haloferax lucentense DSM 14919]ELZ95513.1 hypothetical protein C452_00105 [Haloferax alexandrinus JCM 10717]